MAVRFDLGKAASLSHPGEQAIILRQLEAMNTIPGTKDPTGCGLLRAIKSTGDTDVVHVISEQYMVGSNSAYNLMWKGAYYRVEFENGHGNKAARFGWIGKQILQISGFDAMKRLLHDEQRAVSSSTPAYATTDQLPQTLHDTYWNAGAETTFYVTT